MTFGKKLKHLRMERGLSQPELSQEIGIEQSYLSKLENDKSIPSNDVFTNILKVFNLTIAQFVKEFSSCEDFEKLLQIPVINQFISKEKTLLHARQRRYLYVSSFLIVLASTLFYTGFSKLIFTEMHYQYLSKGIVFENEPDDVFESWQNLSFRTNPPEVHMQKTIEMAGRTKEHALIIPENKGQFFTQEVEGGRRFYRAFGPIDVANSANAWLQVLGVFLFSLGIMGFVLERRLLK